MKTDHLLLIRFSALGDIAMTVPVVYELALRYPHLRITVLSQPFARPLFEPFMPRISFMGADIKREYRGVKGLNSLYRRLIAKKFTAIADLHDVLRTKYLRTRFNIGRYQVEHIDKHRALKRRLIASPQHCPSLPTSFQNYADVLARLGYPISLNAFRTIFPDGLPSLRRLPESIGEKRSFQQWIGIAPFAAHPGKTYPQTQLITLIETLIRRHPSCRIFLFGGGMRELQQLDRMAARFPHCINASGTLGQLQQELILMAHLDVMISMDSGNMHLASLTATPVVSIWGATHPKAGFMGWKQPEEYAVQTDLPCRPCSIFGNRPCHRGDYACMTQISPEQIADRIDEVLARC